MLEIIYEHLITSNPLGIDDCIIGNSLDYKPSLAASTPHWHNALEILYVAEGNVDYICNGVPVHISDDDFVFVNNRTIHQAKKTDSCEKTKVLLMVIPNSFLLKLVSEISDFYFSIKDCSEERYEILVSLRRIYSYFLTKTPYFQLLINRELTNILYCLYAHCIVPDSPVKHYNSISKKVINYVDSHYNENISVSSVAKLVGLQDTYFCRKFKKEVGISFHYYLSSVRLNMALSLYSLGQESLLSCALQSGFASEKILIDWCKKIYHCTPSQYKSQNT